MSFLEQKKKILEQQQEIQRQNQQKNPNIGYSPMPQFNRPQNFASTQARPTQPAPSSYPPAYYPNF